MSINSSSVATGLAHRLPPQAPSHLVHIVNELDEADRLDAPNTSLKAIREGLAFLLGHFTDLVGETAVRFGASASEYSRNEDDPVSPTEAEQKLRDGIHVLNGHIESDALARELVGIFFNLDQGSQRMYYVLTQGDYGQHKRLSDFCKMPNRAPGRSEATKTVAAYRPVLQSWLEVAGRFWEKCEVLEQHTSLKARQRIVYRFEKHTVTAGFRCDLGECLSCIPSREIEVPEEFLGHAVLQGFPSNVPDHALHLVDRFSEALGARDVIESTRLMRDTFEFLLRYFAGVAKTLCDTLDVLPDAARRPSRDTESVDNCEKVLQLCVDALKSHQDDVSARALVGVFYRRTANFELEPRSHTGVLLLEGVLSSWFKRERGQQPSAERSRSDFEKYFPLLRDWLAAMYPYFGQCEHFDEPPSPEGHLPLTVRLGEHLLELVAPEYTLRIRQCPVCFPNPIWLTQGGDKPKASAPLAATAAVVAAPPPPEEPKTFPGEFRPVQPPPDGPKFLFRLVRRLDVYVRRGELPEARLALRDALDYMVRYWAGVAVASARASNMLSAEMEKSAQESLSIHQCEKLLIDCLKQFPSDASPLSQEILQVYYELDVITDELKPLGSHARMLNMDADVKNKMKLLADFCDNSDEADVRRARADLKTYLPVLRDWLPRSQGFFEQCQHHEEEPDGDGRMELVVQFDQTYLELVAPDYAFYVRLGSDQVPDLEVPEWIEPVEPEPEIIVEKKSSVVKLEDLAMAEPFLVHKVAFVGLRANSKGAMCKSGKIKIENAGGGSLTGRAFSNHPCIEVSPARFRDNTQLDYWLDEKSIPRDFVPTLTLRSGGDERTITVSELRPISSFNTLSKAQALTLLYLPSTAMFLAFMALLLWISGDIRSAMTQSGWTLQGLSSDEIARNALGAKAQSVGWPYIALPVASGMAVFSVYRRFSPIMQDLLLRHFDYALVAPSAINLVLLIVGVLRNDLTTDRNLHAMNLPQLAPWFMAFNLGIYAYAQLSFRNKFAEWIPDPNLRKLVGPVLFAVFLTASTLALV